MSARSWIDNLLAPEGQRLLDELSHVTITAGNEISLITRLRRDHSAELVAAALEQTKLRRKARKKFSNADRMYFTAAGLEQASSERTARHRAKRYENFEVIADLCCGIGGDAIELARGRRVVAVDNDPVHARFASLNADANGVGDHVSVVCSDVREVDTSAYAAGFVDPARRSDERRFAAGVSEPPLSWCFELGSRDVALGIKAAPGIPTELVPAGWELEFVSDAGELKESVLWSPALATTERRASLVDVGESLIGQSGAHLDVKEPGAFLLDPDPSVTRAGLVEDLGERLGRCWKIDERIAFLSTDEARMTPFARTYRIEASMPWSLARLRDALRERGIGVVDIRKRGSAVDVDELHSRLKLKGERSATVVLTRLRDRPWAFVAVPVP